MHVFWRNTVQYTLSSRLWSPKSTDLQTREILLVENKKIAILKRNDEHIIYGNQPRFEQALCGRGRQEGDLMDLLSLEGE